MELLWSNIAAIVNGGWKLYLAAFILSAALLFLPDALILQLGLDEFRHSYRTYAGFALIGSASLVLVHIISAIVPIALRPWRDWLFKRAMYKALSELTPSEKEFLRLFVFGEANTVSAPINDGVAGGLAAKRIIYRSSNVAIGLEWPYNLRPIPRKLLKAYPRLLD